MKSVRETRLAESDFLNIWAFVARDSIRAADDLLDAFERALDGLAEFPDSGAPRSLLGDNVRMHAVGAYRLFYPATESGIELLRVVHGAREIEHLF